MSLGNLDGTAFLYNSVLRVLLATQKEKYAELYGDDTFS